MIFSIRIFIIIMTVALFGINCKDTKHSFETDKSLSNYHKDSTLSFIQDKFGLSLTRPDNSDTSLFKFYCIKPFDSSFLLELRQIPNKIFGVYFQEIPDKNLKGSYYDQPHAIYFKGVTFTIDSGKWETIKTRAQEMLRDTTNDPIAGCRDCNIYGLIYETRSKVDNDVKYDLFYRFLKHIILDSLARN